MVAIPEQKAPLTADDIACFVQEWLDKTRVLGFRQVWVDPASGAAIDFQQIADDAELAEQNRRAEAQYLAQINKARAEFVAAFGPRGQAEAIRQFERELCKNDLYYLAKFILGYDDMVFHFHYFVAGTMQNLPEGYRGLREFPRDTFKTTVMGISFIVQQVLRNPNVRILYKSNAEGNAANKVTEAKAHFARCEKLMELFPECRPVTKADEGSGSKWNCPAKTAVQAEGTFNAAGVGSSKTSQHYDLIIGDDFWDEKSVTSPEVMTKCRKEIAQLEYLLATPARGRIVFIGTRFAHDDPTTDLLENPAYECIIASGILPNGRSIFPENLSLRHMAAQAHHSAYDFSCQIMLNPTDDARGFQRSWFRYARWQELRELELAGKKSFRRVILTDAAVEGKSTSDFIALMVVAIDEIGSAYLVEYVRDKLQPSEFIAELFRLADKWNPEFAVRQKTALETTLSDFFNHENRERSAAGKRTLRFYPYSLRKREKKARITAALQPWLQGGRLYFDPDMPSIQELEKELLEHPNSQNDDGIDALSMLDDPAVNRKASHRAPAPPPETTYIPAATHVDTREMAQKKAAAAAAFAALRTPKKRRRERPGGYEK